MTTTPQIPPPIPLAPLYLPVVEKTLVPLTSAAQITRQEKGTKLPVLPPKNKTEGYEAVLSKGDLSLVEIFDSIQGEGGNAGEPMTFVRFSKCNLACDFCDTPYNRVAIRMSTQELLNNLVRRSPKWVLFTGGEPCLQLPEDLVRGLSACGIKTGIETNGMVWNPSLEFLDYITISPKTVYTGPGDVIPDDKIISPEIVKMHKGGRKRVDELRYLICGAQDDIFDVGIDPGMICISPLFHDRDPSYTQFASGTGHTSVNGEVDSAALRRALYLVMLHRHRNARLSLQTHKFYSAR